MMSCISTIIYPLKNGTITNTGAEACTHRFPLVRCHAEYCDRAVDGRAGSDDGVRVFAGRNGESAFVGGHLFVFWAVLLAAVVRIVIGSFKHLKTSADAKDKEEEEKEGGRKEGEK